MPLRFQVVRVRQVGVMAGLLVVAGLVKFGCLSMEASRLFIVLRCCVMVFYSGRGNRKIRWFGVSRINNGEFCFSRHDIPLLRLDRYGRLPAPVIFDQPTTALIRQGYWLVSSKVHKYLVKIAQTKGSLGFKATLAGPRYRHG